MRQVVLDTETTGLNAKQGDRVIEIGCVELRNRRLTGNDWHRYVNPERESADGALAVHGLDDEFLRDKPKFVDIAAEFAEYIRGAELIIHNAIFDVEFLDLELARAGIGPVDKLCSAVFDTLKLARELHPGKRSSLDALCERYAVDNSHRTLHGALLDARLLADVYLAMTRGQDSLLIDLEAASTPESRARDAGTRAPLLIVRASEAELAAHEQVLEHIHKDSKGRCLWRALELEELPSAA